jgi:cytochrome c peroxidase
MKIKHILLIILIGFTFSFQKISWFGKPKPWPKPLYPISSNKSNQKIIHLGRFLFYDPILSADSSISCSSCHLNYSGFTHVDHALSHGIHDNIGFRNSIALMNLAWNSTLMWDGSQTNLEAQIWAPITDSNEMGNSIEQALSKLNRTERYRKLFKETFGTDSILMKHVGQALAQFELQLVSKNSKYDRVLWGKETFTEKEIKGYQIFLKNCNKCHQEPLFTKNEFANNQIPLNPSLVDEGRFRVTQDPKDKNLFKIPTLRNIEFTFPYMHDGRFQTLAQVIQHYSAHSTIVEKPFSSNEMKELNTFLLTLSDHEFLFNPNYSAPHKNKNH